MTTSPLLAARAVRHRRRARDRPALPPRRRPAGVRGVPARRRPAGRALLGGYYDGYAEVAAARRVRGCCWRRRPGGPTPTGRPGGLRRSTRSTGPTRTRRAVRRRPGASTGLDRTLVVGVHGPRGDGYVAGEHPDPDEAAEYHSARPAALAADGADLVSRDDDHHPAGGRGRGARPPGRRVSRSRSPSRSRPTAGCPTGRRSATRSRQVDAAGRPDWFLRQLRPPDPPRPGPRRRRLAAAGRRRTPERLDADPRGAGRHGGARRGRPGPAHLVGLDELRPQLPSPGDRGRLLRHRRPPRRRALGRVSPTRVHGSPRPAP